MPPIGTKGTFLEPVPRVFDYKLHTCIYIFIY